MRLAGRRIYKGITAMILCLATILTSINGFGGLFENTKVFGVEQEKVVFAANFFDYDENLTWGNWNNQYELKFGASLKDHERNMCDGRSNYQVMKYGYAYQGLVEPNLVNGLPKFTVTAPNLFDPFVEDPCKIIYSAPDSASKQIGVEFIKDENGYYILDSDKYHYRYNSSKYVIENQGDYDQSSWKKGFFPIDSQKFFGMNFQVNFNISSDGKTNGEDTIFEFSGDDDVWVFIDGKLVLDMGGIHQKVQGKINFAKDKYEINGVADGKGGGSKKTGSVAELLGFTGKNAAKEMRNYLSNENHVLSVFYLERGDVESNCMIKFNFVETNAAIPTDVYFDKLDQKGDYLPGAEFALYDTNDMQNARYTAVSEDKEKNVLFREVKAGTYYLKETKAPEGYALDSNVYVVKVINGTSGINKENEFYTIPGYFEIYDFNRTNKIESIRNYPEDEEFDDIVAVDKQATLINWDERTYQIDLYAKSIMDETVVETKISDADIVLILDKSGSMLDRIWGIGPTRFSVLKSAAIEFVKQLAEQSPNSNLAIVSYNTESYTNISMCTVGEHRDEIIKRINDMQAEWGTGTSPDTGLEEAQKQLNQNVTENPKHVILFTDGEPTGAGNQWNTEVAEQTQQKAAELKNKDIKVHTVGYKLSSNAEKWLEEDIASEGCSKTTEDIKDLSDLFKTIQNSILITRDIVNARIVDYIDPRFDLLDDNGEVISIDQARAGSCSVAGGIAHYDEIKRMIYVEWNNQDIAYSSEQNLYPWHKILQIKATEDYLGGNIITTNDEASGVYIVVNQKELFYKFPEPHVNVKITLNTKDEEDTIFLGQSLENYFVEKVNQMCSVDGSHTQDVNITYQWGDSREFTGGLNEFEEYVKSQSPSGDQDYPLYITVTPNQHSKEEIEAVSQLMSGEKGYYNPILEQVAVYHVKVLTGTITIEKELIGAYLSNLGYFAGEEKLIDAKQTVVFTVNRYAEDDYQREHLLQSMEVAITFDGEETGSVKIVGLQAGIYEIKELTDWSWKYNGTIQAEKRVRENVKEEAFEDGLNGVVDGIVYIGKNQKIYQEYVISFQNVRKTEEIKLYSDTTNILNKFSKKIQVDEVNHNEE